ncbi:MAG: transporter [Draconibacterium sp.]|nr:MAG: transporter [Draconibacterium sp.]
MWVIISRFILRNKALILSILAVVTLFFGYNATRVEMSYEYALLLPKKDPAYKDYQEFTRIFGEEGNLIIVGLKDSSFFQYNKFKRWKALCSELSQVEGVENLLSVSNAYNLIKNTQEKKFQVVPVFPDTITNQQHLNQAVDVFHSLPFYRNVLYNKESATYLLAITVNKDKMHTYQREQMIGSIQKICRNFEREENIKLHYSGLPYIRVVNSIKIRRELYLFSILALTICIVVLFIFFRSFKAVFYPVLIVMIGVVWSMGLLHLFGYKITILSGMIPPLLIVIGIPNSIYMLNKFHHEYVSHGNKVKALQRVIVKIGNATFLTNLTTASGFATFIMVKSDILRQFGFIASLSILGLFVLSITLIPIIFSFVNPPSSKHVRHLDSGFTTRVINVLVNITQKHRKVVYLGTLFIIGLGFFGISLIKSSGYMVDDIPKEDPVYKDLKFFENNFEGVMPLEILIDTKKPGGVMQFSTFTRMEALGKKLATYPELSSPMSLLNLLKLSKQAFYNGNEKFYSLPNKREKNFILQYAAGGNKSANMLHSFLDSTRQFTRMSVRIKDVGTREMSRLYGSFVADLDTVFPADKYNVVITGSSIMFFKGTEYLLRNLFTSLILAFVIISTFMALMFSTWRMVILSLVPNIIPLIFTAAFMGFIGIPIKASTILVFSIAFGISVDNTIHFLAKYRQELKITNWDIGESTILALRETGISMIYTSIVLFFGFAIFILSGFGGTKAMGVLVSLTLIVAVTSNLILLPSLLMGLNRWITTQAFREPLLHIYDEEEDIELDDLEISQGTEKEII